ncbi:uncharacterized protein LOC116210179 isoform X1 [Punica granatum]|uniref:Uncharacterized protein LOC116210179 isoform X1 n=1 Tax=Punica granatum TaxID=22663 RepID=A0A6P8DR64_PUNGR|nr:uncharacterized protein LOC116210179 isoform X1 [Punica granatum]
MSPKECHQTRNGMGRKEAAIVRVLLPVWLLLAASEHHFPAFAYARAIHSGKLPLPLLLPSPEETCSIVKAIAQVPKERMLTQRKAHGYSASLPFSFLLATADSKLGPDRQNLYIPKENIRSTMGGEKKIRRTPSGPNPAGNQHPPTKKH